MYLKKVRIRLLTLTLLLSFVVFPVTAQRRSSPPRKPAAPQPAEPVLTFDTILTQDSYRIYSEVRNVGQLVRSNSFNDLLEPFMKMSQPPQEFQLVVKWVHSKAEALANSRMFVASWPIRPNLPNVLIAIEFANPDEAKKFEADLNRFMPKLMPKPTPSPAPTPGTPAVTPDAAIQADNIVSFPKYVVKQSGSLVLLTDKPIVHRSLKPRGSHLMTEDPNFSIARNRLSTESLFVYLDTKAIEKADEEERKKWEAEHQKTMAARANASPEPSPEQLVLEGAEPLLVPHQAEPTPPADPAMGPPADANPNQLGAEPSPGPSDAVMFSLSALIFGGPTRWPDAIGIAAEFEPEGYVVRALVIDASGKKTNAIPFMPQFVSGPPITPGAASVMPADLDIFVTLSIDYAQMYESMVKMFTDNKDLDIRPTPMAPMPARVSPFAEIEKRMGLKVKEDILPLLGNELAIGMPKKPQAQPSPSPSPDPITGEPGEQRIVRGPELTPIIAIGVRDKEAIKKFLPKLVEAFSFKGANLLAQTERRGDAEITTYAEIFSYAFIGDYLIVSPDAATTRRVVDSYVANQTLASDIHYRNANRWQPRQVQGQLYAGPGLIDVMNPFASSAPVDEGLREVMGRLSPVIDPLTYALFNDGSGPLHEIHVPKNLLMLFIHGMTSQVNQSPIITNESIAQSVLRAIASSQSTYKTKTGRYGNMDELATEGYVSKDLLEKYGYRFELTILSNKFEATATPLEYGKSGKRSFFVDESGVLRAGDHAGGPATISDKPVEY